MQHTRKSLILLACLMVFCCGVEAQADITLEASLSHLSFPVDQGALLTITVNGASRISTIELPEIAGINFQNRGQSSRINIINGSMSSSLSNNYLVQAQKPGIYTIPPIKVNAGGETVSTKPMSFEVTGTAKEGAPNGDRTDRSSEEVAFIRIPELADHYPGEIVPIRIKAYFNQKYRADINSLPTLRGDGVVMPQLREKPAQTQEMVNGTPFHVLTWDTTLAGIKAGRHPLTFSMEASLLIPQKRRQVLPFGGGLFDDSAFNDPFFDSVFGGAQRKPIDLVSPEAVFNVIPLPTANQPKNFSGAIGNFTLKVSANRQDLEVGEPLKLSVEIAGSGNFDRVEAPSFPDSPDWKTYTPAATFTDQGNSYTGVKVFDQAIVAKNDTVKEILPLSFSYFDPVKKDYVTISSAPIRIKLTKSTIAPATPSLPPQSAAVPAPSVASPEKTSRGIEQMAPLNVQLGDFQREITPLFLRSWFLTLATLCILVLVALFLLQLRRQNLQKHPEKELQRRKSHLLARDLNLVEQAYASGNSLEFLASSRTAMQNQMGLSWNMAPTAISLTSLKGRLGQDSPLVEIFAAADAAAYGGATLSREKMQNYLKIMKKELEALP
ncbi:MAG: BatD family protein [Proteobacteria bacterium]|nr:BatD family protein [Pseudomonadota bacterium]